MTRHHRTLIVCLLLLAAGPLAQQAGGPRNDLPQPYRTVRDWGELPAGMTWPAVTAVEPAPDGTIYVIERCFNNSCTGRAEPPILKYSPDGKLVASWGQDMFVFPHGGTVDRDGNLWVADAGGANGKGHQVFKFSPQGNVLMTLGRAGVSGSSPDLFEQPTDVAVAPNGDIFVTESHRNGLNNRVVKFSKAGKYIKAWGHKGSGPGEFSEPHTIAIDSRGRLFVGDRENNRIQIFDQDGRYLDQWRQFGRPSGIFITRDDAIYVADSESGPDTGAHELMGIKKGIRIGNARTGAVTAFIEDVESTAPDHSGAEGLGVDAHGNVYGAVVRRQMLERHVRREASAGATELRVASSGGFAAAYRLLAPEHERRSANTLAMVSGPSMGDTPEAIPNRLKRGEALDVVILTDGALDALIKEGKVVAGSKTVLARSIIAMAVRAGAAKPDISTVDALKQALIDATSIAYSDSASGVYLSGTLFPRLGIAEQVKAKSQTIAGTPVGEVVARGDAAVGFQQLSELLPIPGIQIVGPLPAGAQLITVFSAGVVTGSKAPQAAKALIAFLASPSATAMIRQTGLEPPAAAGR